jgi:cation diffusion facilitator family transporter
MHCTVLTFLTSFMSMWAWDSVKEAGRGYLLKVASLQSSLVKHSTPLTRKFFFRNENAADRVTLLGILMNIILSISKLWGGIVYNSAVLVSDAGHSLSDLFSDFITLWAVQVARLPADDDHPYGHGKFESVGSLFLSLTLLITGAGVGSWSYDKMQAVIAASNGKIFPDAATVAGLVSGAASKVPKKAALLFALVSILSKEWIFRVTRRVGLALNSQIIVANAWHHRSDAFSSFISLFSIGLAITFPQLVIMDSAAGIFVAGMICLTGCEILLESIKELTDTEDVVLKDQLKKAAMEVPGVEGIGSLRTRTVGSGSSLVDLTIEIDSKLSISAANSIAEKARFHLSNQSVQVKEVFVKTTPKENNPVCPLLTQSHRDPKDIERDVGHLLISGVHEIAAVSKVIVHYTDTSHVNVDAFVKLAGDLSVSEARAVALKGKNAIVEDGRYAADIYLDLST